MATRHTKKCVLTEKIYNDGEVTDKVRVKPGELPVKVFAARNSMLTDLFEIPHIRTLYHISLATLVGLFLHTALYDYLQKGEIRLGFSLIIKGFSRIHVVLVIWVCVFVSSLLLYIGFKYWATVRILLSPQSTHLKLWDYLWLTAFIMYYPSLLYFSTKAAIECNLAIAESLLLTMEITRFLMKVHAYVRSNAPRVLKYKLHAEDQVLYPELSKFLYFSFVPTLIYQDKYPRSTHIRWKYVTLCFFEVLGIAFFVSFVFERFYIPDFKEYGLKPYSWQDIVLLISRNSAAAMLNILNIFYLLLHVWPNGIAEMLRFSDRMFYKDWWTSPTYERYYRTWNVMVHDWLYTYIYKDFYEIILPRNKLAAKYMVFFVSAVFHDYIVGFSLKFYIPILSIQFFGIGVLLTFLKIKNQLVGNVILWYTTALGMSIITCTYTLEYYARINCPIEDRTVSSYFIPRMFSCNK